ncbi:DEAD/DEAH box helicase family protein [Paradesulfitobacterium ferrireducens]|uniref:DEAD/DEAH box helicase family protein n=1 Tax=Paradesulfitobacterium ferrireducens TaxID=2816476 RepID=UPI001A905A45|nr:DEAD/DEAH box helicase family protein [Paradesulfitobacterium ferrireducens]
MLFYLMHTPAGEFKLSPFPELDKLFQESEQTGMPPFRILIPGIPLAYLEPIFARVSARIGTRAGLETEGFILKIIAKEDALQKFDWKWQNLEQQDLEQMRGNENLSLERSAGDDLADSLSGRQLTDDELSVLAAGIGLNADMLWRQAHILVRAGLGEWVPAVRRGSKGWYCERCGESELEEWPGLYGTSFTCPSCRSLGASSSMKVIYRDLRASAGKFRKIRIGRVGVEQFSSLFPGLRLTAAQEQAAREVLEFARSARERESLLWAACGAGKTEVCFPAAEWALAQGQAVLFAAPRQDVVHDVAPRLQQAFPDISIPVLSGASTAKFGSGQLVLATTHQVLRFYRAFDLIFLDELDAFPYRGSRMLQWGINQALRPGGKILFLSATPDSAIRQRLGKAGRIIRLPARHHRRPLPVPQWIKITEARVESALRENLAALRRRGPVIFFVPKISWVKLWTERLKGLFSSWSISGSYSSDPERQEKLIRLRQGGFDLFVATTILERGVTVEGVQVAVMAADHPVFDERTLVQMAGRAGRTRAHPEGEVVFFAARATKAMKTAVDWIHEQNELARSAGLLD